MKEYLTSVVKKVLIAAAIAAVFLLTAFVVWDIVSWSVFNSYVDAFAAQTGWNSFLVKALAGLMFIPFYVGTRYLLNFRDSQKRRRGILILAALYFCYNLGLYWITKDYYHGKWYVRTPEGIEIYDRLPEDGRDPVYGFKMKPITPEIVAEIMALEKGCSPVDPQHVNFFNKITGELQVWYYRRPDGAYDFFNGPCYHPQLGIRLAPVTRAVVKNWRERQAQEEAARRRRERRREAAERRARERAEAEQRRRAKWAYRQQYINMSVFSRLPKDHQVVLVTATGADDTLEDRIARALTRRGADAWTDVLKQAALHSGIARQLAIGSSKALRRLGLSQLSGHLMLYDLSFGELQIRAGCLK